MKKILSGVIILLLSFQTLFAYSQNELSSANKLASEGIISQQDNAKDYRLNDNITRKEFMKVVANITKETIEDTCDNSFNDVADDWGCKYIEWALKKWFIAANATFRPDANITKAESMKLILKARWFIRVQNTDDWRVDDMMSAAQNGIISQRYYDYDTFASRWWIFEVMATEKWTHTVWNTTDKTSWPEWRNATP